MLEKINVAPSRLANASDLYDWDELVQEDRVHRLIYTDPAIFQAEMTQIFGAVWVYLGAREPDPQERRFHHHAARPAAGHPAARLATARSARCSTAAPIAAPRSAARTRARRAPSPAPITAGATSIPASCARCRGRTAMPAISRTRNTMSRRCRASTAIAASSSRTLNRRCAAAARLSRRRSPSRSTNGSTASPSGKIAVCEANRLKFKGNWKLAYDNSGDGYHVVFSHRSLLEMENRQADVANKGMSYYKGSPDTAPMYMAYMGNGHHFKDKRPNIEKRAGGLWAVEGPAPGTEHYQEELRRRYGARAEDILDLASSEPVNINVFPNFSLLGNHIQVFEPVSVDETNVTWYGTAVVDEEGALGGAVDDINALRMRTHGAVPEFRRGRRSRQFRGDPARARLPRGRMGLHAPRASAFRAASRPTPMASSRRPPPTRPSCANTSRNGNG